MNIFRLAGDMMHLLSIVVLLLKILATKSCRGARRRHRRCCRRASRMAPGARRPPAGHALETLSNAVRLP
jgi:hypothetical protein